MPAVIVFRLCVDCNKLNELQAHFPRKFGTFAVQLYAPYVLLDVGFVLALFLQLFLQCGYLGLQLLLFLLIAFAERVGELVLYILKFFSVYFQLFYRFLCNKC